MKMVPDVLLGSADSSAAERRLFELLSELDLGAGWRAYHSLNCSEHAYKRWSEIDFLLVGPAGLFVLEVKGGRIRRQNGIWIYKDRFDREHRNTEGPFNQAKSAMHGLLSLLRDRGNEVGTHLGSFVPGWGVVFPDIDWNVTSPETPSEVVADRRAMSRNGLGTFLNRLAGYWRAKSHIGERAGKEALSALHASIRPDVDLYPPMTTRIGDSLRLMQQLTEEQYRGLEMIEANDRIMVEGGAGTGKTFLLIQCARRETAQGRRALVVVESPELAAWLRKLESDDRISIVPWKRLDTSAPRADVLLVDEGQDLLSMDAITSLDSLVEGGLDHGRWRWFMDTEHQARLSGRFEDEALDHLRSGLLGSPPTRVRLRRNVRNTREVIAAVEAWTGADVGIWDGTGKGRPPQVLTIDNGRRTVIDALEDLLDSLMEEGADLSQIALILPKGDPGEIIGMLPRRLRRNLMPLDPTSIRAELTNKVVWGCVDRFKGLERPIVICVGFDDLVEKEAGLVQLYVATTRANFGLYYLLHDAAAKKLRESLKENGASPPLNEDESND
jgi:hypothetical protein